MIDFIFNYCHYCLFIGIVFGPTLLRTSEGSASLSSLVDTVHQTRAIELLVIYADEIFGSLENILPKPLQTPVHSGHHHQSTIEKEANVDISAGSSRKSGSSSKGHSSSGSLSSLGVQSSLSKSSKGDESGGKSWR